MAELRAPDMREELKAQNVEEYLEKFPEFRGNEDAEMLIQTILALEISRYVLFHIGGEREFSQEAAGSIGSVLIEKYREFKNKTGKDFVSVNCDW